MWNDCPVCGTELISDIWLPDTQIHCTNRTADDSDYHYYAGALKYPSGRQLLYERYVFNCDYSVERLDGEVNVYNKYSVVRLPCDLPANKFNTLEKIKRLLLIA